MERRRRNRIEGRREERRGKRKCKKSEETRERGNLLEAERKGRTTEGKKRKEEP